MSFKQRLLDTIASMNFGEPVPKMPQSLGKVSDAINYTQHHGNMMAVLNGYDQTDWNRRVSNLVGTVIDITEVSCDLSPTLIRQIIDQSLARIGLQVKTFNIDSFSDKSIKQILSSSYSKYDSDVFFTLAQVVENNGEFSVTIHQYIKKDYDSLYMSVSVHDVVSAVRPLLGPNMLGNMRGMAHAMISNYGVIGEVISYGTNLSIVPFLESVWVQAIATALAGKQYSLGNGVDAAWEAYRSRAIASMVLDNNKDTSSIATTIVNTVNASQYPMLREIMINLVEALRGHGTAAAVVAGMCITQKFAPAVVSKEPVAEAANV